FPLFRDRFGADAEGVLGIGGVNPDDPAYQEYFERHVAVTGREPDRWASAYTYASLQMLQQAIERVGSLDREAIIAELQTGTFETVAGTITLDRNVNPDVWWVGQWQDGEFYGLAPSRLPGASEPRLPKPAWGSGQ
ncbi:MAG: ABC transporter substrate-binding protein, partial [Propionibacteriaceae bacterium]|nr:ABC transporter substrate-binding protein [Propionibacteriaceae bacterium]